MRLFFIYSLVVTLLLSAPLVGALSVDSGYVYPVNLSVLYPLSRGTSWAGLYGVLPVVDREKASYYSGAFGYLQIAPTDLNEVTSSVIVNLRDQLHVTDYNDWWIAFSPSDSVDFTKLQSTCDKNLDALLEGNFCPDCSPQKTFTVDKNILVGGITYCAKGTLIYGGVPTYVLLSADGNVVYLGDVGKYTILGTSANFGVLASIPQRENLFVYLVRKQVYCGDGVCDPTDPAGCSDCVGLEINVNPLSWDVNVGQAATYLVTVQNVGFENLTPTFTYRIVSGDSNGISVSLSATKAILPVGEKVSVTVTAKALSAGDYGIQFVAQAGDANYYSPTFYLRTVKPPAPQEQTPAPPGGTGETNTTQEQNKIVKLKTGGFYIPWKHCISNVRVSGPDRVNAKREENVTINYYVQNGGTCAEDLNISATVSPDEPHSVYPTYLHLRPGEGQRVVVHVVPHRGGLHTVVVSAKGLVESKYTTQLFVSAELARPVQSSCKEDLLVNAPSKITIFEGQELNAVIIKNLGTCPTRITVVLSKSVGGVGVTLDRKEIELSPGETYHYIFPSLAAGNYTLDVRTDTLEKKSTIIVEPKPLFQGVSDTLARARLAVLAFLVVAFIVLAGYLRYRYLR